MPHRLTEKDKTALTATCSECGAGARIRKNGRYGYVCVTANRQSMSRYKKAHPDRVRASHKAPPSQHQLQNRKGGMDTCPICGPVESVAVGRGWMCPNRAAELNWKNLPDAPLAKPAFDAPLPDYDRRRPGKTYGDFEQEIFDAGLSIVTEQTTLPSEIEKAVPGWKTLGSNRPYAEPLTVRPEYAALYGGKK